MRKNYRCLGAPQAALLSAIRLVGGQAALARIIKVSRKRVNNWLNRDKSIPYRYAVAIEKATNGQVSRYELNSLLSLEQDDAVEMPGIQAMMARINIMHTDLKQCMDCLNQLFSTQNKCSPSHERQSSNKTNKKSKTKKQNDIKANKTH